MDQPNRRRHHVLVTAILASAAPAFAATAVWLPTAPSSAVFSDPANWLVGTVPSTADSAHFATGSAHTVTLSANVTNKQLVVSNDNLTLDLAGHTYSLTDNNSAFTAVSLSTPTARLNVINGSLVSSYSTLSPNPTDVSTVTLLGPTTSWTAAGLNLAPLGTATLAVSAGASFTSSGTVYVGGRYNPGQGSASVTVSDPGTKWFTGYLGVGTMGTGSFIVENGASANLGIASVASPPGSTSTLSLRGATSSINASSLSIGAVVNIESGSFTAHSISLINTPGASLNLSGGSLVVGSFADKSDLSRFHWTGGSLDVSNGEMLISPQPDTSGTATRLAAALTLTPGMSLRVDRTTRFLTVDNGGSLSASGATVIAGPVRVGVAGTGSVSLADHATVTSRDVTLGSAAWIGGTLRQGTGAVTLDSAASWSITGSLTVGADGGGTLAVKNGASLSNANADIAAGTTASSASVDGAASSWNTSNLLTVGKNGQGFLTISNAATLRTGSAMIGSAPVTTPSTVIIQGDGTSWQNTAWLYVALAQDRGLPASATITVSDHARLASRLLDMASSSPLATGSLTLTSGSALVITDSAFLGGMFAGNGGTATASLADSSATIGNRLELHNTPNTSLSLTRSTLAIGTSASPGSLDNAASVTLADHSTLTLHGTLANAGTVTLSPDSLLLWDPGTSPAPLDALRAQLATNHVVTTPSALPNIRLAYVDLSLLPADRAQLVTGGLALDAATLLTTVALTGDTNLDGTLDADDYALLDRSCAMAQTNAHWTDGDFDYDGTVTSADYLLIDSAFASQAPLSPAFLTMRESRFGAEYVAQLLTSIPEPSALVCLLTILPLTTRRRSLR